MRTRHQRLLPLFLALACLVLLLIPFYYVDLWSVATAKTTAVQQEIEQEVPPSKPPAAPPTEETNYDSKENYVADGETDSNKYGGRQGSLGNDDDSSSSSSSNITTDDEQIIPRPHVAPPVHGYGQSFVPLLPFQQNVGNMVDFALRMARDRLLIEMYGPAAFHRRRIVNASAASNDDYDDLLDSSLGGAANASHNQVLVVTYFRGGTTFFGDILNEYPGTFYHFEPLHMVSQNDQVESPEDVGKAMYLLRHLLRCQYESLSSYVQYVRHAHSRFLLEHNRRLWFTCQFSPSLCYNTKFLNAMCRMHPIHVLKVVRLRLAYARRLLNEFPSLRVIYLVRDPRGLYSSRRDLSWCNVTRSCIDPYSFCADMRHDLAVAAALKSKMPDRFLALRYEYISIDTENQMARVLKFLGLRPHQRLNRFITSHTRPRLGENLGGPYSTKRDSKKAPFMWKRKLSGHEVAYVEDACLDVIKRLNFT